MITRFVRRLCQRIIPRRYPIDREAERFASCVEAEAVAQEMRRAYGDRLVVSAHTDCGVPFIHFKDAELRSYRSGLLHGPREWYRGRATIAAWLEQAA